MKKTIMLSLLAVPVAAVGLLAASVVAPTPAIGDIPATAVMHQDPNCGCCAGHRAHLERHGIDVEIARRPPGRHVSCNLT